MSRFPVCGPGPGLDRATARAGTRPARAPASPAISVRYPRSVSAAALEGLTQTALPSCAMVSSRPPLHSTSLGRDECGLCQRRAGVERDGMRVYYNYTKKHGTLRGTTPAEASLIKVDGRNKWYTLSQNAALNKANA